MRKRITLFERIACTGSVNETPHRKWREIDLQLPCWLQLTLLGWCLASLPFLYGVSSTDPVDMQLILTFPMQTSVVCIKSSFNCGDITKTSSSL